MSDVVVQFNHGSADIVIGGHTIQIGRRDDPGHGYLCPVDLVSASLGS